MQNKTPLVSVIIPVYNARDYIREAIVSAIQQTYKNTEIIVIDDGSTDCLKEVIADLIKSGTIKYYWQPNQGPAAARNLGNSKSKGEFIAFLDADDIWLPQKIENQIKLLIKNPKVGLVYCNYERFLKSQVIIDNFFNYCPPKRGKVTEQLLKSNLVPTSTVITRKQLLILIKGFNPKLRQSEDYDLWLRLSLITEFDYCNKILSRYRFHEGSLTTDKFYLTHSEIQVLVNIFMYKTTKQSIYLPIISSHIFPLLINLSLINTKFARAHFYMVWQAKIHHWKILLAYCLSFIPKPLLTLLIFVYKQLKRIFSTKK